MKQNINFDNIQLVDIVVKDSKTGFMANKRLLVLKSGYLYYYSNVPKGFKGDLKVLEANQQNMPKCCIQIANIINIKGDFRTPLQFQIQFEAKNMMQKNEIRKTVTREQFNFAPKNSSERIKWKFTCQSKEIRDNWIQTLKDSKEYFIKQKINIQSFFQSTNKDVIQKNSGRKSVKVPWMSNDQQNKLEQQQNKIKIEEIKKQKQLDEKERQRKRKLQQQKIQIERKKKIQQETKERIRLEEEAKEKKKLEQERKRLELENKIKQQQQRKRKQQMERIQIQKQLLNIERKRKEEQQIKMIEQDIRVLQNDKRQQQLAQKLKYEVQQEQTLIEKEVVLKQIDQHKQKQKNQIQSKESKSFLFYQQEKVDQKHQTKEKDNQLQQRLARLQLNAQNIQKFSEYQSPQRSHNQTQFNSRRSLFLTRSLSNFSLQSELFTGSFKQKIQSQKQYYIAVSKFRDKCATHFEQIINELSVEPMYRRFKISSDKIVELEDMVFKIGMTSTKSMSIANTIKIFYDESQLKNIKREFEIYDKIQAKINHELRQGEQMRIRVPLTCFLEYKGIGAIVYKKQLNEQILNMKSYNFLDSQFQRLQIRPQNFVIKKKGQSNYIIYVKKLYKIKKNNNLIFNSPLTPEFLELAEKNRISISIKNLKYNQSLIFKQKNSPQKFQILQAIQYTIFCKYIRKLYRAAQGEIDQLNFWNLILKKDKEILQMLKKVGCQNFPVYKTILLSYIKYFFETTFQFESIQDPFSTQFPIEGIHINPITKIYKISYVELQQSIINFQKYVKEGKLTLAQQSLQLKQQLFQSKFQNRLYVKTIMDKALLLNAESDIIQSIKQCKRAISLLHFHDPYKFIIYSILLKNFEYSEDETVKIFKSWIQLIFCNYGNNHYSLITLYCIMAYFFSHKKNNLDSGFKLYNLALNLYYELYKVDTIQSSDIYLDMSRMYKFHNNYMTAFKYLQMARKVYRTIGQNNINYIKLLIYSSTLYYCNNELDKSQRQINKAIYYLQSEVKNTNELIECYKIAIHIYNQQNKLILRNAIIEKLWNLGGENIKIYKICLELCFSFCINKLNEQQLANLQSITHQIESHIIQQIYHIQSIIQLKKGYENLIQLLQDMFFTILNKNKSRDLQYQTLYDCYITIVHIVDSVVINSILQSYK